MFPSRDHVSSPNPRTAGRTDPNDKARSPKYTAHDESMLRCCIQLIPQTCQRRPFVHEALDPLQDPLRRQVRLVQHLVQRAAGAPAVVPVGREGVLLGDLVEEPVVHQPARLGGDHGRVGAVGRGEHLAAVRLRLQREQLRAGRADDLHVQPAGVELRQRGDDVRHRAGALDDHACRRVGRAGDRAGRRPRARPRSATGCPAPRDPGS